MHGVLPATSHFRTPGSMVRRLRLGMPHILPLRRWLAPSQERKVGLGRRQEGVSEGSFVSVRRSTVSPSLRQQSSGVFPRQAWGASREGAENCNVHGASVRGQECGKETLFCSAGERR